VSTAAVVVAAMPLDPAAVPILPAALPVLLARLSALLSGGGGDCLSSMLLPVTYQFLQMYRLTSMAILILFLNALALPI
jgi:hypothetical protein